MKQNLLIMTLFTVALVGCASMPTPQYVSPKQYQSYDCQQLDSEYQRLTEYIRQNPKQNNTFNTSGIGVGISAGRGGIYPNITFGVGTGQIQQNHQLTKTMGERDAIVQAGRFKQCPFVQHVKLFTEK